jgi:predicted DNA repair protein MutK
MNKMLWTGLIIVVLGIICLVLGRVGIQNKQEVFRVGTFTATSTTTKTYPALGYAGYGLLAGGVIVVGIGYINRR